ncbi:hypothetical protein G7066_12630 [Leucobacter coleopterorum]|uniref:Uncharacterized protein n=1 Tax=Leucobacter coleopterorum TaxID=2714933 RepID=A0ABX6JY92_9MICO|nr:SpaA isopeptide-forming pilin-related protein [Leucobacter coleopterorum]QIM19202.1 hypothetical protein G7066_12630 [Leucobacter coleopterorum]
MTGLQLGGKIIPPRYHYNAAVNFDVRDGKLVMSSMNRSGGQFEKGELLFYDLASLNYVSGDVNNRQQPVPEVEFRPDGLSEGARFAFHYGNIVMTNGRVFVPYTNAKTLYVLEPVRKRSASLNDVTVVYGQGGTVSASLDSAGKDGGTAALAIDSVLRDTVTVAGYAANFILPNAGNSYLVGTHPMSVSYTGPSGSSAVVANANLIVTKASTAIALSPLELSGDTQIGVTTTIRGQVTAQYGTIPTGKVTVTVNGGNAVEATLDANGRFVAELTGQQSSSLAYVVTYSGDANHLTSTVSESTTAPAPPASAAWSVAKSATVNALTPAGGVVKPGDVIDYEVTATAGTRDIDDVVLTDDLSGVLGAGTFVPGSATLTIGSGSAVSVANPGASDLLKTVAADLPAGEKMTLKYRVVVDDDAWFESLTNTVTAAGATTPTNCVAGASPMPTECSTTHVTGALFEVKKVSRDVGGAVTPLTGASFEVLQDAAGTPGTVLTTLTEESGNPGVFKLKGLRPGTYWLSEVSSPAGFTLLPEPAKFVLSDTGVLTLAEPTKHSQMSVDKWTVTVVNSAPVALPLTGGFGSLPYIGAGVLLTLVASGLALNTRYRSRKTA